MRTETRLPWWLVLLLAVWVVSLIVWARPSIKRELRWLAGVLSLSYLLLLFVALSVDFPGAETNARSMRGIVSPHRGIVLGGALCLVSAMGMLGRPSSRGQLIWFSLLTLSSAGVCQVCAATALAWSLMALSAVTWMIVLNEMRRGGWPAWREIVPVATAMVNDRRWEVTVLAGVSGFLVSLLLIGTLRYSLRVETTRATSSQRYSAMPSAEQVRTILETTDSGQRLSTSEIERMTFGERADVVVLLAVLVFMMLAMMSPMRQAASLRESDGSFGDSEQDRTQVAETPLKPTLFREGEVS